MKDSAFGNFSLIFLRFGAEQYEIKDFFWIFSANWSRNIGHFQDSG
jgi:hypothetical protein